jgi:putative sugar O-methyltransferase
MESVSNNTGYPDVCLKASQDEEVFKVFKTIPEYTQILEHTSIEYGHKYIELIKRDNPQLLNPENIAKFKTNDLYGGSSPHDFGEFTISPSTLRYIKVLSDLIKVFGSLDGFKIAEIGGGYGGQCKVISDYFDIKGYHIADIDEANKLTAKYLDKLNVENVRNSTFDKLEVEEYDLVISNYAYTELDRGLQDSYKKTIIDGAANGYITNNFIIHLAVGGNFATYSKDELLNLKTNMEVVTEEPLTSPDNFITVWKR